VSSTDRSRSTQPPPANEPGSGWPPPPASPPPSPCPGRSPSCPRHHYVISTSHLSNILVQDTCGYHPGNGPGARPEGQTDRQRDASLLFATGEALRPISTPYSANRTGRRSATPESAALTGRTPERRARTAASRAACDERDRHLRAPRAGPGDVRRVGGRNSESFLGYSSVLRVCPTSDARAVGVAAVMGRAGGLAGRSRAGGGRWRPSLGRWVAAERGLRRRR
jgi:hypothetical protein